MGVRCTRVALVHEFEQLVHHRSQELPVLLKKARILPDHVHDVTRDERLVMFPFVLLTEL